METELEQLAVHYRQVQVQTLVKLNDNSLPPLNNLDYLLDSINTKVRSRDYIVLF